MQQTFGRTRRVGPVQEVRIVVTYLRHSLWRFACVCVWRELGMAGYGGVQEARIV